MATIIRDYLGINSCGYKPDGTKSSHEEQYSAIVNLIGLDRCITFIPFAEEVIRVALKEDSLMNLFAKASIPLHNQTLSAL